MAGAGSKVLALRSVEFARNHGVPLHVRSAFTWEPGTWVTDERRTTAPGRVRWKIRSSPVSSPTPASRRSPCSACPTGPGISATLFEPLAAANVNVDMIVQNTSTEGKTDISFTMPSADMGVAEDIVSRVAEEIGATGVTHDSDIAKVSLVGAGMKSSPGIAAKMFRTLADEGVNIEMISTSTIRISVVIASADLERAARALHTAFGLDTGADYAAPLPERESGATDPRRLTLRKPMDWLLDEPSVVLVCVTVAARSSSSRWPCRPSGSPAPGSHRGRASPSPASSTRTRRGGRCSVRPSPSASGR